MKQECCNIHEIIQKFYNYLKAYIMKHTKNADLAEDLVQEVMIKLVESHQKNIEIKNIKAWLFQVSRHTIYDYFKADAKDTHWDTQWKEDLLTADEFTPIMEADYIIPMLDLLPESYALPLKLSDIDGIPQKEIAVQLNMNLSATKMRIQRARVKLRELFVECCEITYDKTGTFVSCSIKPSCTPLHEIHASLEDQSH